MKPSAIRIYSIPAFNAEDGIVFRGYKKSIPVALGKIELDPASHCVCS